MHHIMYPHGHKQNYEDLNGDGPLHRAVNVKTELSFFKHINFSFLRSSAKQN